MREFFNFLFRRREVSDVVENKEFATSSCSSTHTNYYLAARKVTYYKKEKYQKKYKKRPDSWYGIATIDFVVEQYSIFQYLKDKTKFYT